MRNTLCWINSRLDTLKEKITEPKDNNSSWLN